MVLYQLHQCLVWNNFTTNKQNQSYMLLIVGTDVPGYSKIGVYQGNGQTWIMLLLTVDLDLLCVIIKAHTKSVITWVYLIIKELILIHQTLEDFYILMLLTSWLDWWN